MSLRRALTALAFGLAAVSPAAAEIRIETKPYVASTPPPAALTAPWKARFSKESFTGPDGTVVPYRLYRPASSGRLPVVLVLHGSGAIGGDNEAQMGALASAWADPVFAATHPAIVVAPQAPARTANYAPGDDGLLASVPGPPLATILALVEQLSRDPGVDPARISVVGFSMGASAAMQAVLARPGLFAGAVAFSAVPPPRDAASRMPSIPVLLVHGDRDDENPIAPDRAWAAALDKAGATGRFIVYGGMDHRVPDDMLTDPTWRSWLIGRRR